VGGVAPFCWIIFASDISAGRGLSGQYTTGIPTEQQDSNNLLAGFLFFFLARLTISVDSTQSRRQFRTGQKTFLWFYSVQFNVLKLAKKTSRDFYLV
jgi:outer membrane usher protein FimD/PapC